MLALPGLTLETLKTHNFTFSANAKLVDLSKEERYTMGEIHNTHTHIH